MEKEMMRKRETRNFHTLLHPQVRRYFHLVINRKFLMSFIVQGFFIFIFILFPYLLFFLHHLILITLVIFLMLAHFLSLSFSLKKFSSNMVPKVFYQNPWYKLFEWCSGIDDNLSLFYPHLFAWFVCYLTKY